MDASDVTVCVLNYDGRDMLDILLPSLFGQTARGFGVHVIDNGSRDGSPEHVTEHWPQVHVVRIPENVGVTRAMNRAVLSAETPYVAILNNDLELAPTWLEEMRGALEAHPEAASADCKLINFHRRGEIDGAGDLLQWTGECHKRGFGEPDRGQYDVPGEIFSASAGAALYRRAAFDDVGLFDEDFWAYYEDVDWGFRAQLRGHRCRFVPSAVAYHMGSATTSRDRGTYSHLMPRNNLQMLVKNFPAAALLRHAPRIALFEARYWAADLRDGLGRAHARGWWQALRMAPKLVRKRRAVQRARRIGTRELERAITPGWRAPTPGA